MMISREQAARLSRADPARVRAVYAFTDRVCVVTDDGAKHWATLATAEAVAVDETSAETSVADDDETSADISVADETKLGRARQRRGR
jgi:hypothetical protein